MGFQGGFLPTQTMLEPLSPTTSVGHPKAQWGSVLRELQDVPMGALSPWFSVGDPQGSSGHTPEDQHVQ